MAKKKNINTRTEAIKKKEDQLTEISKPYQKNKRFTKYTALGINRKVCQQIMRDFTKKTENDLIKIANRVNADEFSYDLRDILFRGALSSIIGKFIAKIINTQSYICDAYNYFGRTIKKIFSQAREADSQYSARLSNKSGIVVSDSVKLLKNLNSSFSYYEKNKEYGCSIDYALQNIYCNDHETITLIDEMTNAGKEKQIKDFVLDEKNAVVFDKYSKKIYKKITGSEEYIECRDSIIYSFDNIEKIANKIAELATKKIIDSTESDMIKSFIEDKEIAGLIKSLVDATGIPGAAKAAITIDILFRVKNKVNEMYVKLFNKIRSGKSDDYKKLQNLYNQLKALEKDIIESYRGMNEFNPDEQVNANDWLYEVDQEECGEL